jgi:hypothetical protein
MTRAVDISELLHLYFIQHKSVSLPGIGTFSLFRISAHSDFATKKIFGPSYSIHFSSASDAPSREMFNYISRKKNISEWEAVRIVNEFSFELNGRLKKGEKVAWPGIGTLESGSAGQMLFEPERVKYQFIPSVDAERVIRKENDHSVLVGEQEMHKSDMQEWLEHESYVEEKAGWWIPSAIIGAVALLVLFFSLLNQKVSTYGGRQSNIVPTEATVQNQQ